MNDLRPLDCIPSALGFKVPDVRIDPPWSCGTPSTKGLGSVDRIPNAPRLQNPDVQNPDRKSGQNQPLVIVSILLGTIGPRLIRAAAYNHWLAWIMGYESLSGGQRQRVLIARALYRQPRYLFADEVTASLDESNHVRIGATLAGVEATKVIITHRGFATPGCRMLAVEAGVAQERRLNPGLPVKGEGL